MKKHLLTALAVFGMNLGASADILAQWDFNLTDNNANNGTLTPTVGNASASLVGISGAALFNAAQGSSDPAGNDIDNSSWRIINFPAQSTGNKTAGVQFNVDTTGHENITLSWDQSNNNNSSKYYRIFYSIDNGATWIPKDVIVNPQVSLAWNNPIATVSFATIPGANNNTNFGVRLLSEFQSTATGSGTAGYVTVVGGGTYNTTAAMRLDMVTFNGSILTGNVNIFTNPVSQLVAVGQPVSFSVIAGGGSSAIGFQWRTNSTPIPGATNSTYSIISAQLSDARDYDVVVTNSVNSVTSTVATLTVRVPLNLAWTGLGGTAWDSSTVSWVNTNTLADVAYAVGDHVLFDSRGISAATVNLAETLQPSSVTVDADFDYLLRTDSGGKISGATGLIKRGTGKLQIDTDNSYSGATVIEGGTLQIGVGTPHGTLGTGPIINNSALVFYRSDTNLYANNITGTGTITNIGKGITLAGNNVYNGDITVLSGALQLTGNQTINSQNVRVTASDPGIPGSTIFSISGGINTSTNTALTTYGNGIGGDYRVRFSSVSGTNRWNGPIYLSGINGLISNHIQSDGSATMLEINGDISGIDGNFSSLFLRGTGNGIVRGRIYLPGLSVLKTDASTWTISSTNNEWASTTLAVGTLRIGANNALPTNLVMVIGQSSTVATLDLNGYNQQLAIFQDAAIASTFVTNSSAVSDSTLTVSGNSSVFSGLIVDGVSRKTGLTLNGGTLTLAGNNTFSGPTTVNGSLTLSGSGSIQSSSVISVGAGSSIDATPRSDGTLHLSATQTLKGNGAFNIGGNLSSEGNIELKVNKTGSTLNNDSVQVTNQITYGGALNLVLSGNALTANDSIKLFNAGSYTGSFATITPAAPAAGLLWDTNSLATDGTLRIVSSGVPSVSATFVSGTNVVFSGTGGPASGNYYVLSSTNVAAPVATWTRVQTNAFDSTGNFSVTNGIAPGVPQKFFILQLP